MMRLRPSFLHARGSGFAWGLLATLAAGLLALGVGRGSWDRLTGDEPTFVAMAASLAHDFDLRFTAADRDRVPELLGDEPWMLILQREAGGIAYSKPVLYPLLAAPFYGIFGRWGLLVLNAVATAGALAVAYLWLCRLGPPARAAWTLVSFAGAGVLLPYVGWSMSDSLQLALALAGVLLASAGGWPREVDAAGDPLPVPPSPRNRWLLAPWASTLGGALLGMLGTLRLPNLLILATLLGVLVLGGRWRPALRVAAGAAAAFLAVSLLTATWTGTWNPYGAERTAFRSVEDIPLATEAGAAAPAATAAPTAFEQRRATHHLNWRARLEPRVSLYALLYSLVGRHTGLLFYFPFVLVLVPFLLRRGRWAAWGMLAGFLAFAAFYLLWLPRNYYGGGTFLGNRYILAALPLLIAALPALPRIRHWFLVWLVAASMAVSAGLSLAQPEVDGGDSQAHAYAGLPRLLPYESSAGSIGPGRRDRYWAGDLVRFVDPFARAGDRSFTLRSDASRPAELMVATARLPEELLLHVKAPEPELRLAVKARGQERSVHLKAARGDRIDEIVRVTLLPPWRRHAFWWQREPDYWVRLVRVSIHGPAAEPAVATLHYLGDGGLLRTFEAELLGQAWDPAPEEGMPGEAVLRLQVRNASPVPWPVDGVAPVQGSWQWEAADGTALARGLAPLAAPVAPGEIVELEVAVPDPPSAAVRLVVDLRLGEVRRFAEVVGRPLLILPRTETPGG